MYLTNEIIKKDTILLERKNSVEVCVLYQRNKINLPVCTEKEKMKTANAPLEKATTEGFPQPCNSITNINFFYSEMDYGGNGSTFSVRIIMPTRFKHIIQTKAIEIETLIGTMGGYLGLFCGKCVHILGIR